MSFPTKASKFLALYCGPCLGTDIATPDLPILISVYELGHTVLEFSDDSSLILPDSEYIRLGKAAWHIVATGGGDWCAEEEGFSAEDFL